MKFNVGDKVRVIEPGEYKCYWNNLMREYVDEDFTVTAIRENDLGETYYRVKENSWRWYPWMVVKSAIIARQVPPEEQSIPDMHDYLDNYWFIMGNAFLTQYISPEIKSVLEAMDDSTLYYWEGGSDTDEELIRKVTEVFPPIDRGAYSATEAKKILELYTYYDSDHMIALCKLLSIVTGKSGKSWKDRMICGGCQGDWNYLFYAPGTNCEELEALYFNTGSEWVVDGISVYVTATTPEEIKKTLCEQCGEADYALHFFDHYQKTAVYVNEEGEKVD